MAYCNYKGYARAYDWRIDYYIGEIKLISTKQVCKNLGCDCFEYIRCKYQCYYMPRYYQQHDSMYIAPRGVLGMGKAAADAYCRYKSYYDSNGYEIDIGHCTTKLIGDGNVCHESTDHCGGFKCIDCY